MLEAPTPSSSQELDAILPSVNSLSEAAAHLSAGALVMEVVS